jgi:hypothetical protein
MDTLLIVVAVTAMAIALAAALTWPQLRDRGMDRWLLPYLVQTGKRGAPRPDEEIHLLLCFADHYEPTGSNPSPEQAQACVDRWVRDYPLQFGSFRDSDARPPRYTFFYPIEEYEAAHLDALAGLCRAGYGEVELHLHHRNDTAEHLRAELVKYKEIFAARHGLLSRHRQTGALAYGFIHGNWALCNARPDGDWCGVNNELDVLRETGCYADLTMPSAPHVTQTRKINSIYYARNCPGRPRSHDQGADVGTAPQPPDSLLLVQGPLVLDWRKRKAGLLPTVENGCIQANQRACIERLPAWLRARVQVPSRPDWFFVKLHTHGAQPPCLEVLLGESMVRFHRDLAALAAKNPRFHYHYLTAREMVNVIKAAEAGWHGSVADARDYLLVSNIGAATSCGTTPPFAAAPRETTPSAHIPGRAAPG